MNLRGTAIGPRRGARISAAMAGGRPGIPNVPQELPPNFTRPTASMSMNPAFGYTTGRIIGAGGTFLAANETASGNIALQAAENFLCDAMTCDFDQDDWTFRVAFGGMSANLFNQDIRGVLVFGPPSGANVSNWPGGWKLPIPMLIPSNTTITFTVTNGATGNLNIFFAMLGNRLS